MQLRTPFILGVCALALTACDKKPASDGAPPAAASSGSAASGAVPNGDTSRTSLDWNGTYKGLLPCADCEGIETTIVLKPDDTFTITRVYKGGKAETQPAPESGRINWSADGSTITLGSGEERTAYRVEEGRLRALAQDGTVISSALPESVYLLSKQP